MRAVICEEYGPPENLRVADTDPPQPGAGDIHIAVKACGVNFPDFLIVAGKYQVRPPLPFTPGAELAGEILAVGDDVSGFTVGQRVLAMTQTGAMAAEVCVPAAAVMPIPDEMDFAIAAGFLLTYGTSWHALKQRAALQAGETLLVLGAAGGVGLAAVELGVALGADVIAAASTAEKLRVAREHGATHGIAYAEDSLKEQVNELTSGRGADVIFDPVGGNIFDDCLRSVAWNGRILVIGFASGDIQAIPANLPLLKGASVVGVFWGRFTSEEPGEHVANTKELLAMYSAGKVRPRVSAKFPLDDAAKAIRALADRRAIGKVIVEI